MASASYNKCTLDSLESVTCSICLDVFEEPQKLRCSHVFCQLCLLTIVTKEGVNSQCPLCKTPFRPTSVGPASEVEITLKRSTIKCEECNRRVRVCNMRRHTQICSQKVVKPTRWRPAAPTSQSLPTDLPNRSTFKCPLCSQRNLELSGLRSHCKERHSGNSASVVCPVCASMPWGDPTQTSANFLQHLELRHKFEYDTYVDYEQDDDDMLQRALEASISDD